MEKFNKTCQQIMNKDSLKEAMRLAPDLTARLVHKMDKFGDLSYEIASCEKLEENVDSSLRKLRATIGFEAMNVLGALNAVYREYYNDSLFKEFIDYKHVQQLTGDKKQKTLSQIAAVLNVADICCREIWGDYLIAENDEYMVK